MKYNLYYLTWNVTNECNLRCKHCYASAGLQEKMELSKDEALALIDDALTLGLKYMLFTGGEPLLRKDLFEIIEYAYEKGITVFMATNGLLISDFNIEKIKKYISKVNVSLDYATSEKHDEFRGVEGAFDKANEAIKILIRNEVKVSVSMTVCNQNIDDVEKVVKICANYGVNLTIKRLISVGRSAANNLYFSANEYSKLKKIIAKNKTRCKVLFKDPIYACEMIDFDKTKLSGCLAGIGILSVTATGEVLPCTKIEYSLGNIKNSNLSDIWDNSKELKKLREREIMGRCQECKELKVCGGCRAAAYKQYDSLYAEDPLCGEIKNG
ncbi:MAG: radical SAM protein [Candidatus Cloacimonetes bacterium]|nr:radical SAM protein [Candidatus Cloacimonadota bacterium]